MDVEKLVMIEERMAALEEELRELLLSNQNHLRSILLALDRIDDKVNSILFKQI